MLPKNLIRRIATAILSIVFFQNAFCQESYQTGYIIPLCGDTLRGYIDYRNWERNPNTINFKNDLSKNKIIFKPLDIKGFRVLNEIYVSAIVKTEVSPINTENLQLPDDKATNKELVFKTDTTFLQAIVQGEKSLYYYCNRSSKDQFYIKQDTSYSLLIYKKYLKRIKNVQEEKLVIAENNKYLGQLTIYLQNCPNIQAKINETKHTKKSLENLFNYYYNNTQATIKFQTEKEKTKVEYGILAGVSSTELNFNSEAFPYLDQTRYTQPKSITAGVFMNVIFRRNQGKWSINNELIYTTYKDKGSYSNYVDANQYTNTHTTIGYSYIKMNNMLRFKYPIGGIFIYLNGGVSNGYAICETNYKRQESKLFTTEHITEGKAIDKTRKYEYGLLFGLGTKYKRYSVEVRYETASGMSANNMITSSVKRYYLLLGIKL